jgi:hypothetical protein
LSVPAVNFDTAILSAGALFAVPCAGRQLYGVGLLVVGDRRQW